LIDSNGMVNLKEVEIDEKTVPTFHLFLLLLNSPFH